MSQRTINYQIRVTNQFDGLHCWPEAPEQVKFLRTLHRHQFCIYTEMEVKHDDRELEFFIFKETIDEIIEEQFGDARIKDLGRISCEEIATTIHESLIGRLEYLRDRSATISVFEDDENGAVVKFSPENQK